MVTDKSYYRRLDSLLDAIEHEERPHRRLARMVNRIVDAFGPQYGLTSGRLYTREGEVYILRHSTEALPEGLEGFTIPADYPPLAEIRRHRAVAIHEDFPGFDPVLEGRIGVRSFAGFFLADGRYLISFGLEEHIDEQNVIFFLSTIQHSLSLKLRQAAMEAEVSEAEAIQQSLLPPFPPHFAGFDIAARTYAAEAAEVGGDIHDFIEVSENILGIAVGDASGHGLPAALQARDVVTGLRMGVAREMKITSVMQRLNKVIYASRLTSRFVSLFYGELERNGTLIYVNAGHCDPMLLSEDGSVQRLHSGGLIIGPTEDAEYHRGYAQLIPGSQLLIFTDGLIERSRDGEEFGEEQVRTLFRECFKLSAADSVDRIINAARDFGGSRPWEDDVTAVVIKPT